MEHFRELVSTTVGDTDPLGGASRGLAASPTAFRNELLAASAPGSEEQAQLSGLIDGHDDRIADVIRPSSGS